MYITRGVRLYIFFLNVLFGLKIIVTFTNSVDPDEMKGLKDNIFCSEKLTSLIMQHHVTLTNFSLASFLWNIGKQFRSEPDQMP